MSRPVDALRGRPPERLLEPYEDLRRRSFGGRRTSQEQVLFIDQGMLAWMRAWSGVAGTRPAGPSASFHPPRRASEDPLPLAGPLQVEVSRVLAGMVLGVFEEVH